MAPASYCGSDFKSSSRAFLRLDDMAVGAEQTHFPAREAFEQPPERPRVAVAVASVGKPSCGAVVGLPDPIVIARRGVPHLIELDHHRIARRRLGAAAIDITAHPAA